MPEVLSEPVVSIDPKHLLQFQKLSIKGNVVGVESTKMSSVVMMVMPMQKQARFMPSLGRIHLCWEIFCLVITCLPNSVGVGSLVDSPEEIVWVISIDFVYATTFINCRSMAKHIRPSFIVDLV